MSQPFRLSRRCATALVAACALAPVASHAQTTNPNVTISQSLSYLPQNSSINLLDLGTSTKTGLVSSNALTFGDGNTISFTGTAGIYQGLTKGLAAPPWTPSGVETKNYFAAEPNGDVIFKFQSQQKYFAINWGSVDSYNTLNFYQGGTLVQSLTGSQVTANPTGVQNASGSYLVNFNFNGAASFDQVVMRDFKSPAFEFNVVAYAPVPITITAFGGGAPVTQVLYDTVKQSVIGSPAPLPGLAATPFGAMALLLGARLFLRRREVR